MSTKVLVVDDEEGTRRLFKRFFASEGGYEVLFAENGARALEIFKEQAVELVFMDVRMPEMDGIETFHQMRRLRPEVKVVIVTGLPDEGSFDRALAVSEETVEGFLVKPFEFDDLRKCLSIARAGDRHAVFRMTPTQLEALGRFATAAMGVVAEALSEIVGRDATVSLQGINVVPLSRISKRLEEPGQTCASLSARFDGAFNGRILLLLSWEDAAALTSMAMGLPSGAGGSFDEAGQVLLKSLGTVLAGAYVKTLAGQAGLPVEMGATELLFEHRDVLIASIMGELSPARGEDVDYMFTIETELRVLEPGMHCWLTLIPSADSLKKVLHALGVLR